MPTKRGPNLGRKSRSLCVRVGADSYEIFKEMADLNDWSVPHAVRYCAEQFLNIRPSGVQFPSTCIKAGPTQEVT